MTDYDIDKRFARIRVEVAGEEYTDVVRVKECFPDLPGNLTVYVEHVDAVDLKQQIDTTPNDELRELVRGWKMGLETDPRKMVDELEDVIDS